jgi:hypothetical protein
MVGTVNDDSRPPDDSISRIDALALIGGSMGYDEAEAADYLADCARGPLGQGRVEWTSQNEIIIDCVVGPLFQGGNRPQSPGPEQLEQAIRSRLWEQARRGEPGVHVKGDSATYRAAAVFVSAFGGWQLESPPEEGVSPTGPEWLVEINFKLIKYRLSQVITVLRADGGLLEAGLERLRSLGRASPAVAAAIDQPPTDPSPTPDSNRTLDPVPRRGKTDRWVEQMLKRVSSKGYTQAGYVDEVLVNRNSGVVRKTLANSLSRTVRDRPELWQGGPSREGPA